MKRIPKILAASCAAVVLSASLVLAAGAAAPAMSNDAAPANCPATGAAMPMQGSMLKGQMNGRMMQGGQMGSSPMGTMLSEENPDSRHGGGHGGDGHNRAGYMNGMGRMGQIAMQDRI